MGYIEDIRALVGNRPLILVASAVMIFDKKGRILLQLREDTKDWGIPGGFMELGETTEETAKRELFEETGLKAGSLELFRVFSGERFSFTYPNGDQVFNVIICYIAKHVRGNPHAGEESLALKYFDLQRLPDLMPTSRLMLEAYRAQHRLR